MDEDNIRSYLKNPETTTLEGVKFKINYPNLQNEVSIEFQLEEIIEVNRGEYSSKKEYFDFVFRLIKFLENKEKLKEVLYLDPSTTQKNIIQGNLGLKIFNFWNSQLVILFQNVLCEIEFFSSSSTFVVKIYCLEQQELSGYTHEIEELIESNRSIFGEFDTISSTNTKINSLYTLVLLNTLIDDYHFFRRNYGIFSNIQNEIRNLMIGIIKISNLAYQRRDQNLFLNTIALFSLFVENRLADLYEREIGSYNDDKTLGGLINSLVSPNNHLQDIDATLNRFKDIRNNLIHFHRRTFEIEDCFIDTLSYLGQFLIWCEENGYL